MNTEKKEVLVTLPKETIIRNGNMRIIESKILHKYLEIIALNSKGEMENIITIRWYKGKYKSGRELHCQISITGNNYYLVGYGKSNNNDYMESFYSAAEAAGMTFSIPYYEFYRESYIPKVINQISKQLGYSEFPLIVGIHP